jgi:hypothetical protein
MILDSGSSLPEPHNGTFWVLPQDRARRPVAGDFPAVTTIVRFQARTDHPRTDPPIWRASYPPHPGEDWDHAGVTARTMPYGSIPQICPQWQTWRLSEPNSNAHGMVQKEPRTASRPLYL